MFRVAQDNFLIETQASNRTEMLMLNKKNEIQDRLNKKAIQNFIPQVALTFGFMQNWDSTLINPEGIMFFGAVARWESGFDTARQYYEYQAVKLNKAILSSLRSACQKSLLEVLLQAFFKSSPPDKYGLF